MTLTPRLRKFALSTHVMFSVGWIGAVVSYLALGVAAEISEDPQTMRADRAQEADVATLKGLGGDLIHPGIGLVVLLVIQFLNIYKPRGMTRYGWRKQNEHRLAPRA